MKCQSLFSGKNKKNVTNCHLLNFLPSMQSVYCYAVFTYFAILNISYDCFVFCYRMLENNTDLVLQTEDFDGLTNLQYL